MNERLNNINEQISISDLYERAEREGSLTPDDYKLAKINLEEDDGLMVLPNDFVVQTDGRVNLKSIIETDFQETKERGVINPRINTIINSEENDEELRVVNEKGVEVVIEHDNSDMYRRHDKSTFSYRNNYFEKRTVILELTEEKDRHYLKASALVENIKGQRFMRGFTNDEAIVKRFIDENGKWPKEKSMRKYMALTKVSFNYEVKNSGGHRTSYFDAGEIFLAPKSFEDIEKKAEMDMKNKK